MFEIHTSPPEYPRRGEGCLLHFIASHWEYHPTNLSHSSFGITANAPFEAPCTDKQSIISKSSLPFPTKHPKLITLITHPATLAQPKIGITVKAPSKTPCIGHQPTITDKTHACFWPFAIRY